MTRNSLLHWIWLLVIALWIPALGAEESEQPFIRTGDQINFIDFDTLPVNFVVEAGSITLDGDTQVNGDLTATGTLCDANGCIGQGGGSTSVQEALLTFDRPSGSGGGSANNANIWLKRDLNEEIYDIGNIVTLSNSRMTLDAGTYRVSAGQTFFCDDRQIRSFRGRLRDIINDTTVALSMTGRLDAPSGTSANMEATIPPTVFAIDSTTIFELQFFIQSASSGSTALGFPVSSGEDERYAWVYIEKL